MALYIVALDDLPRLLARRGAARARRWAPVPPARILARYPRTMDNLAQAVRQADVSYLYDAAEATGTSTGPQLGGRASPRSRPWPSRSPGRSA